MSETQFSDDPPKNGSRVEVVHGVEPRPYVVKSWVNGTLVDERGFSNEERRREFASRLRAAMERKGWTQSETAKAAAAFLPRGEKLGRAHVSHYVTARAMPRPPYLSALSKALELSEAELMGSGWEPQDDMLTFPFAIVDQHTRLPAQALIGGDAPGGSEAVEVRDIGDGGAWLHIDQRIPWATALEVLKLLKGDPGKG